MRMQAIVKIGSSQYLVSPGQEIVVDRLTTPSEEVVLEQVLMLIDGESVIIGQPYIENVVVKTKRLGETRGEKIRVSTFKAKSRLRKVKGFRAHLTHLLINDIVNPTSASQKNMEQKLENKVKKVVKKSAPKQVSENIIDNREK